MLARPGGGYSKPDHDALLSLLTFVAIYVLVLFMDGPPPAPFSIPCSAGADVARGDAGGVAAERAERHLRMLAELAEIGMELARDLRRQVLGEPGTEAVQPDPAQSDIAAGRVGGTDLRADLGLVFSRIARAVRQTVALEARLAAEAQAREQQDAAVQASRMAAQRARAKQQKERVKRLVEEAIASEADGRDAEGLLLDLDERLDDPDVEAELGWRPLGVIVAGICENLGIEIDLSGFSDAELGFDRASMRPNAETGTDAQLAPAKTGPNTGFAADTGDPPAALFPSPWPPRATTGHDPP
jgi:hypothetical protein